MLINKEYRIRIYLKKRQEVLITKTISCSRFLFKRLHTMWNNTYKETEKRLIY
ncbi:helix-turn-helix domain-containing protein [Bacillus cereus group sp. BfR-BA-01524]|uniref:helix-turn-helix domain-containing protein n=1 Tax=Bacillus cereus group sp. BfR-BA-01524 TaxID=2920372 RepID=UPI001F59E765|nr:helix-turn-helix domain-containing protein [Bacillus cereus]MDA2135431.1 helix-turn-helix domain-containing protein [Bacillus cereus]